jgi:hypothetical protein
MWMLITLLVLVGVAAYFVFFWSPEAEKTSAPGVPPETRGQTDVPPIIAPGSPMQIQAQLTKSDYSKFRRYALYRIRKAWLIYVVAALIFTWEIFPKDYAAHGIPFAFALVSCLIIAGIAACLIAFITTLLVKFMPNRPGTVLGPHTFTLTDSEFQEVNAVGSASAKLELLRRYETSQHVFLLTPTHVGYILPMRDLQANPEFLRVLREGTKAK